MQDDDIQPLPVNRSLVPASRSLVNLVSQQQKERLEDKILARNLDNNGLKRPANWPGVMSWPPLRLREAMKQGIITSDNAEAFQQYVDKYANAAQKRQQALRKRISEQPLRKRGLAKHKSRLHEKLLAKGELGIAWACMVDPTGDYAHNVNGMVLSWDSNHMHLNDGGRLYSSLDSISVKKASPQAATLIIDEARARGWEKLDIAGNRNFVMAMMAEAQKAGIVVDAVIKSGPFGLMRKRISNVNTLEVNNEDVRELNELTQALGQRPKPTRKPEIRVGNLDPDEVALG